MQGAVYGSGADTDIGAEIGVAGAGIDVDGVIGRVWIVDIYIVTVYCTSGRVAISCKSTVGNVRGVVGSKSVVDTINISVSGGV